MASGSDVMITLRDFHAVPESIVLWMLNAEDRGVVFRIEDDGRLYMGPRDRVDHDDVAFVRAHRDLIRDLTAYCERQAECPL